MHSHFRLGRDIEVFDDTHHEVSRERERFISLCLEKEEVQEVVAYMRADRLTLIRLYLYLRKKVGLHETSGHRILFECFYTPEILLDGNRMTLEGSEVLALDQFEKHIQLCLAIPDDVPLILRNEA